MPEKLFSRKKIKFNIGSGRKNGRNPAFNLKEIYRSIVETSQEGILAADMEGRIIYANKRASEMLGYKIREIKGLYFYDFLDKKEQIFISKNPERRRRGTRERRLFKKDGLCLWSLESISPLLDNNGKLCGQLVMITDITDRKNIEEKLKKTHNELELKVARRTAELVEKNRQLQKEILERRKIEKHIIRSNIILKLLSKSSSYEKYMDSLARFIRDLTGCQCVGIRVLNDEGTIPYKSHIGFNREFLDMENLLSIYTDKCACIRVIGGQLKPREMKVTTPNGSFYCNNTVKFMENLKEKEKAEYRKTCAGNGFYSVAIVPVTYKNKIFGAIHVADKRENMVPQGKLDIIEPLTALIGEGIYRFNLEARRNKAEKELMKTQKKLIETKRLSDIGTLAATVAHELRNPLGVIQMAIYNISKKANNASLVSHIANIEKKISESNNIINNLLSYSRIRTPHAEKINVFEILNECVDSARERFNNYEVQVNKRYDLLKGKLIEADPYQVKEIFNNIINNAYQSLPDKKGEIAISTADKDNGAVNINIRDNGCGIDKEDLDKVFNPFFTRKSKGTGLGLTICKELITMHGGKISIESERGKGTNISIDLPGSVVNNAK